MKYRKAINDKSPICYSTVISNRIKDAYSFYLRKKGTPLQMAAYLHFADACEAENRKPLDVITQLTNL